MAELDLKHKLQAVVKLNTLSEPVWHTAPIYEAVTLGAPSRLSLDAKIRKWLDKNDGWIVETAPTFENNWHEDVCTEWWRIVLKRPKPSCVCGLCCAKLPRQRCKKCRDVLDKLK